MVASASSDALPTNRHFRILWVLKKTLHTQRYGFGDTVALIGLRRWLTTIVQLRLNPNPKTLCTINDLAGDGENARQAKVNNGGSNKIAGFWFVAVICCYIYGRFLYIRVRYERGWGVPVTRGERVLAAHVDCDKVASREKRSISQCYVPISSWFEMRFHALPQTCLFSLWVSIDCFSIVFIQIVEHFLMRFSYFSLSPFKCNQYFV